MIARQNGNVSAEVKGTMFVRVKGNVSAEVNGTVCLPG